MKTYKVERLGDGTVICSVFGESTKYSLPHVVFHSPTGFETGYAGSGPSDLALSIMADHYGVKPSQMAARMRGAHAGDPDSTYVARFYQLFKDFFIMNSTLQVEESYSITTQEIEQWIAHEATRMNLIP